MKRRVTIKDLAKVLDLNVSTISRALSDHPNVSKSTKEKVTRLAKELKYKPNMLAKNFRNSETKLIALIVPDLNNFFIPSLIRATSDVLAEKGYNLLLLNSNESLENEIANIQKCEAYSVDGILLSVTSHTSNLDHVLDAVDTDLPIVQFDRVIPNQEVPSVTINDHLAAKNGTQLLIDHGITHIYGVFGHQSLEISKERFAGYQSALADAGLGSNGTHHFASSKEDVDPWLKGHVLPNAQYPFGIFCNSDEMLVEVYKVLNKEGIQIPEQVSLSCISDGVTPKMLKIDIPYVEHSGYDVGSEASKLLLDILQKDPTKSIVDRQVSTKLVNN